MEVDMLKNQIDYILKNTNIINLIRGTLSKQKEFKQCNQTDAVDKRQVLLSRLRNSGIIDNIVDMLSTPEFKTPNIEKINKQIMSILTETKFRNLIHVTLCNENDDKKQTLDAMLIKLNNAGVVDAIASLVSRPFCETPFTEKSNNITNPGEHIKDTLLTFELHNLNMLFDLIKDDEKAYKSNQLGIWISLGNERFKSLQYPCSPEITINEVFEFNLDKIAELKSIPLNPQRLLVDNETDRHVHIMCVQKSSLGHQRLLSSCKLNWKKMLYSCSPEIHSNINNTWCRMSDIELTSVGSVSKITTGKLTFKVGITWPTDMVINDNPSIFHKFAEAHFLIDEARLASEERSFSLYCQQWWKELPQSVAKHRPIKMFAIDENNVSKLVCRFVAPLRCKRLLESVQKAVHFVASIPCESWFSSCSDLHDIWCSGPAMIARNRGGIADHANLLCSLLLGFGLNAFIAIGKQHKSKQSKFSQSNQQNRSYFLWVVTIQQQFNKEIVFWNPVTGYCISHKNVANSVKNKNSQPVIHQSDQIYCLYNHKLFYANIQRQADVSMMNFD